MYKRRNVPVFRDFPEGCGVFSGHVKSNAGESLMQSKCKAHRGFPDFFKIEKATSNHCETESSRIRGFDYSSDVGTDESVLESNGENEEEQNQSHSTCSTNARNTSLVMQGRLSLHNSTKEVERDVVDISKRVIVSGLAAKSKCPWRQPTKRGSRQDKRRCIL